MGERWYHWLSHLKSYTDHIPRTTFIQHPDTSIPSRTASHCPTTPQRIGSYCSWFLLNVCLSTFQITSGRSNLSSTPNPKIVVGNHISNLDPIILTATFGDFSVRC